jgi:hypothetical protein
MVGATDPNPPRGVSCWGARGGFVFGAVVAFAKAGADLTRRLC